MRPYGLAMSTQTQPTVDEIVQSLSTYSRDALQRAINLAREPGFAANLAARLRDHFKALEAGQHDEDFSLIAMCIALGEAHAVRTIPTLLDIATTECDCFTELAAQYALRRMGPAGLDAAMRFVESGPSPGPRTMAYEILFAAEDAHDDVRARVADFCLSRVPTEMQQPFYPCEWNPSTAACEVLALLGEERVRTMLDDAIRRAQSDRERDTWQQIMRVLEGERRPHPGIDWHVDWPDAAQQWAHEMEEARSDVSEEFLTEEVEEPDESETPMPQPEACAAPPSKPRPRKRKRSPDAS